MNRAERGESTASKLVNWVGLESCRIMPFSGLPMVEYIGLEREL